MKCDSKDTDLIIVAGGAGARLGCDIPKAFMPLFGKRIIDRTLQAFNGYDFASIIIVCPEDIDFNDQNIKTCVGGKTRGESVFNGLQHSFAKYVFVHDAARPFADTSKLSDMIEALRAGAISTSYAAPVTDSLVRGMGESVDRRDLWALQTPQGFDRDMLFDVFEDTTDFDMGDETKLMSEYKEINPTLIPSSSDNFKITYPEDFARAEKLIVSSFYDVRVGQGFDVHRFCDGDHITIAGIKIPHNKGIEAHSDGDVVFHALSDALYGTISDHDIGHHFSNMSDNTKNMDSIHILQAAHQAVQNKNGILCHLDVTILAEEPKMSPFRDHMRQSISNALNIQIDRVSIKATTMEKMDSIGKSEGIGAMCNVTVRFGS